MRFENTSLKLHAKIHKKQCSNHFFFGHPILLPKELEENSVELWKDLRFDEKSSIDEMRKNGRNKSCSKESEIINYKSSSFEFKSKNLSREI